MTLKSNLIGSLFLLGLTLVTACTASPPDTNNSDNVPPTVNPLYQFSPTATPEPTGEPTTPTPKPTLPPLPTAADLLPTKPVNTQPEDITVVDAIPLLSDTRAETIFGDRLAPNWSLEHSWATDIDLENEEYVIVGETAVKLIPIDEYGAIFFTVRDTATKPYLRDQVLGLRFWLYTYNDYVATDDLVVTMQGSNQYPYWAENDNSIAGLSNDDANLFSETQLVFLNVSRDISPNTWFNIEVWLDELVYDPDYEYVTGFYIKNDANFQRPYYIDDVEILLLKDEGEG